MSIEADRKAYGVIAVGLANHGVPAHVGTNYPFEPVLWTGTAKSRVAVLLHDEEGVSPLAVYDSDWIDRTDEFLTAHPEWDVPDYDPESDRLLEFVAALAGALETVIAWAKAELEA